jgi:hypothetical protein
MVHNAKVDRWLAVVIGGTAVVEVGVGATILLVGLMTDQPSLWPILGIAAVFFGAGALIALVLWGCYRTRYEVAAPHLIVRFGPLRSRVPLDAIVEVFPTHNPLSAPAPSLDRLRINYRTKAGWMWFALVSPRDKEGFVRDLASAAPQLHPTGDGPLRLRADGVG